jgi:hypothetical protein
MSYLLWSAHTEPGHCVLGSTLIPGVEKLHHGETVPPDFAQPIAYPMNDLFPDDIALSDNYERAGQVIVSKRLRAALEHELHGHHLQFLPVTILNHKGRVAAQDYFILHSHDMCDCIDLKASKVRFNPLDKKEIMRCEKLVINDDAVPDDLSLFRLERWGSNIIVRKPLADALLKHGFVGLSFVDPLKYKGM